MNKQRSLSTNIIPVLLALLSSLALCMNGSVATQGNMPYILNQETTGITLPCLIITIFLIVFYKESYRKFLTAKKGVTHSIAACFSLFMLLGISYINNGNCGFLFYSFKQFLIAAITFSGYFILFDIIICLLYAYFSEKNLTILNDISDKVINYGKQHYPLFVFTVITICWLPFLIVFLPGSVPHDGAVQINMFFDMNSMTNNHPWLVSIFMGFFVKLGCHISDNFGIFLITLIMYLIEALCYTVVCTKIYSWKLPATINFLSVSFFAIVPVFGGYAAAVIKDSLFTSFFSLYMALFIDLIIKKQKLNDIKHILFLLLIGLFVCFTRNNGIYLVIPTYFSIFFLCLKQNKKVAPALFIATLVIYFLVESIAAPLLGVNAGSKGEMLSIPFQQTARYLKEYPGDVSDEEKRIISKVLDYDNLAENYNPEISDPVKSTFHAGSVEDIREYLKIWFRMLLRHPNVYLEATLNNTYGYLYPFHNCDSLGAYQLYQKTDLLHISLPQGSYVFSENIRSTMHNYALLWRNIPVLGELVNPGAYTWLLILLVGYCIYCRRFRDILVFIPPAINVLVCIASPVNGLIRYALPLMACAPLLIAFTSYRNLENSSKHLNKLTKKRKKYGRQYENKKGNKK